MNLPKAQIQKVAISGDMDFFYPESMRSTDFMDVDLHQNYQPAPNTGLIRYRSAPSSFFKNINADSGGGGYEEFTGTHPRSPEESSETVFGDSWQNGYSAAAAVVAQAAFRQQQAAATSLPPLQNHNSNLLRQSSSPPGVLDNMAMEIGFTNGVESSFSMGDRKGDRGDGTKGFSRITMPQISEIGNLGTDPSFPIGSWDESPTFSPPKKFGENIDGSAFSSFHERFEAQNGVVGNITPPLAHHLSLPKTYSADMGTSERVWPFQDSVPCRVRAKRGCATHPRSIAERMRRTRISERMRKLQELFPNMDKQTNTADMLEVAVECIKNLQKQVKTLTDTGAKCTCSSRERQYSDPTA